MSNITILTTAAGAITSFNGRDPWCALARAEANIARLKEKLGKGKEPPTGDRLYAALAAIASDADECRVRAWSYLANLRRRACSAPASYLPDYDRVMLHGELQTLSALVVRRQRALRDDGAAEEVYRWHTHRGLRALWRSDDLWQLAKSREDEFANELCNAASTVLVIEAALLHARSDIWRYIAKLREAFAMREQPDAETIVALQACRAEITGLHAMLPAAKAASRA